MEGSERYRLDERIGEGGMAEVWRGARRLASGTWQTVAIKRLRADYAQYRPMVARFEREARLCMSLEHENLARVYQLEVIDGRPSAVMEYVDGIDLHELMRRRFIGSALARSILCDVLAGLDHAHTHGVLHRDISLRNIMVTRHGTAKLIDFGLAQELDETSAQEQARSISDFQGTLPYASREALECEPHTRGSDIYSVGAVFHQFILRYPPYGDGDRLTIVRRMEKQPYCQLPDGFPDDLGGFLRFALGPTEARTNEAVDQAIETFFASLGEVTPRADVAALIEQVRSEMADTTRAQAGTPERVDTLALPGEHDERPEPRPRRRVRSRLGRVAVAAVAVMAAMLLSNHHSRTFDAPAPESVVHPTPADDPPACAEWAPTHAAVTRDGNATNAAHPQVTTTESSPITKRARRALHGKQRVGMPHPRASDFELERLAQPSPDLQFTLPPGNE